MPMTNAEHERKLKAPAVPTSVPPSKAASVRSNSMFNRTSCRSSSDSGVPWKACMSTARKASNSSELTGLIG